jgi:manganese/zinc/iron transport system substrate-binding protein
MRLRVLVFTLLCGVLAGGIGAARSEQGAKVLKVAATTGMVADTVARVAGERAEVAALMGPSVDPHLFRPTRTDIAKLSRADLIFYNGLYLEAQMEALLAELGARKPVVPIAERVPQNLLLAHGDYQNRFDPHVWMDPELWSYAVEAVRDALIQSDPDGKTVYEQNAGQFLSELKRLADYSKQVLATVPEAQRVLITAHDAFNYFGRAYNFTVLGIQGISTESEAGLKRIEELVDVLVGKNVGAIFVETTVADRNVQALIEGAAARGHTVKIGGELYSDAMGAANTYEGSFIGMLDHNSTVVTRALGGAAPERGMAGKLNAGA